MGTKGVIDAHLHTYKTPEIGRQAMQGAGRSGCSGTIEEILQVMDRYGIAKAVMMNVTPVIDMIDAAVAKLPADISAAAMAEQLGRIKAEMIARMVRRNEWTCAVAREHHQLVPFFSVDPLMDGEVMVREIDERVRDGGKGLKLHPSNCRYFPGDRGLWPAYKRCEEIGLPVIFHGGAFMGEVQYSLPKYFKEMLASFPKLTVVLAHLGHGYYDQTIDLAKSFANVFFDTSVAICGTPNQTGIPKGEEVRMIHEIGVDRLMFGSDWPWYDPGRDIELLRSLNLSEREKDLILYENAVRIYKLE